MDASYDAFGNRTAQVSQGTACPTLPSVPSPTVTYNAYNQVTWVQNTAPAGFGYDGAGNVTSDNKNVYAYDGEGRICAVSSSNAVGAPMLTQYIYDAEGNRVAKGYITNWSAGCDTTRNGFTPTNSYVLGPADEQLTETDGNGNWKHSNVYAAGSIIATYDIAPTGNPALHFQLEDWLGTRRVQTDISGCPEEACSSLPFGDALTCSDPSGAPTTADDATENHFTGKERDAESGNDYFDARYYSSSMGRFMSPDWSAQEEPVPYAVLSDPQSLNLYAYVRNNPLTHVDTDGHYCSEATPCEIPGLYDGQQGGTQLPHPVTTITVSAKRPSLWSRFKSWLGGTSSGVSMAMARWGRLGGPDHRAAVRSLSRLWESEGYTVDQEHLVRTPGGAKSYRFADVHGEKTNEDGSISERYGQIGRTYANGSPVAREQSALNDIQQATEAKPEFYDYQAPFPMEGGLPGWPVQPAPAGMAIPEAGGAAEEEPILEP